MFREGSEMKVLKMLKFTHSGFPRPIRSHLQQKYDNNLLLGRVAQELSIFCHFSII